uniref:Glucuronosyltransferase n=1 Tax=Rhabditophanes sp. KR3021 TaxID=114890 RepID=A0AC35TWN0_9BILA
MASLHKTLFVLLLIGSSIECLKILVISPQMGKSHVNFMGRSSDILVMAGHNVTYLSVPVDPKIESTGTKLAHVVKIPESPVVSEIAMKFHDQANSLWVHNGGNPLAFLSKIKIFTDVNVASCKNVVDNDEFTRLMREEKFDIGITESFDLCAFGALKMYNVPVTVSILSGGIMSSHYRYYGLTYPVAQLPEALANSLEMNFFGRMKNILTHYVMGWFTGGPLAQQQELFDNKFGKDVINIVQEVRESAFHLSNEDPYFGIAHPLLHKIVEIGGFSVLPAKKLEAKWDAILNKNKINVLVSFGSNAKSVDMPADIKNAFLATFKKMSHVTFIWKYENPEDGTAKDLDNVVLSPWLDQTAILNDPRVSAFITHGGLNSVTESAIYGTKLLVIGLFADQFRNSLLAEKSKFGIVFLKEDASDASKLTRAVEKLIEEDSEISRGAKRISEMIKNRPQNQTDVYVKHIEFAAKFGKLPNLNMQGHDMPLYQYILLDVIAFVVAVLAIILGSIGFIIFKIYKKCAGKKEVLITKKNN